MRGSKITAKELVVGLDDFYVREFSSARDPKIITATGWRDATSTILDPVVRSFTPWPETPGIAILGRAAKTVESKRGNCHGCG